MKTIQSIFIISFVALISTLSYAKSFQLSKNTVSVNHGSDFCQKTQSFISDLNRVGALTIRILQCDTQRDGWSSDTVLINLSYEHKNCLKEETYFRPLQFSYTGVYYIDAIKKILEDMGLKFIAQTSDDVVTEKANNGSFQITVGIPRCMDEK